MKIFVAGATGVLGRALASVFVVGIAGLFVALLALECALVARERASGPPARAAATPRRRVMSA